MNSLRYYINLIQESELVEPQTVTKQVRKLDTNKLNLFWHKNAMKDHDSGAYAYARSHLSPQQIRLISYKPSLVGSDPKLAYLQAVAPLMGANPFVPTVDEIRLVQADNLPGMQKPMYIIERLLNYDQVPPINLYETCRAIVDSFGIEDTLLTHNAQRLSGEVYSGQLSSTELSTDDPDNPQLIQHFNRQVDSVVEDALKHVLLAMRRKKSSSIAELQQVLDIIYKLEAKFGFSLDLHMYNVMFRSIGRGGYQLVITDPLAK